MRKASRCKQCGEYIVFQKVKGDYKPFDASFDERGNAHPLGRHTCKLLRESRHGLGNGWHAKYVFSEAEFPARLSWVDVDTWEAVRYLSDVLCQRGGPFENRVSWCPADVEQFFLEMGIDDTGTPVAFKMQSVIFNRIHYHCDLESDVNHILIGGYYIVKWTK